MIGLDFAGAPDFTGIEHNPTHFETAVRRIGAAFMEGQHQ